ncbi:hypothetical protein B0H14DRAFT_2594046 [Mycena olivaceomarginata]|nr:hypothetical protein B0H14DRAFT_2594046 [Mycena olivaceomarginata]
MSETHPPSGRIIGGLDECDGKDIQREILRSIGNSVFRGPLPIRFFISSRPESHITVPSPTDVNAFTARCHTAVPLQNTCGIGRNSVFDFRRTEGYDTNKFCVTEAVQGNYLSTFTYPDPARVVAGGLDPRIMAPLAVGDYIIFSGIKTPEGVLALYSLEANLGIRTAPGTKPAYLTVESANYGIIDPNPNLETGETRAVAFATDATTTVEWFAIDVNPCTGEESERQLVIAQGSGVAPIGKIVYRLGKVDASPATREVSFRYTSGTSPAPRGIVAGQFIQPIFKFIFPELITFGANEVPNQFDVIPFLALGSGPLEFGNNLAAPLPSPTIVDNVSPQAMTKLANGQFTLAISTKGKPSSVKITSSLGGTPVTTAV